MFGSFTFLINFTEEKYKLVIFILIGFILVFLKNSSQIQKSFKTNLKMLFLLIIMFSYSIMSLNKVSEFLYFNF